MFEPALHALSGRGLRHDIETMHLDRGYDCQRVRDVLAEFNIDNAVIARRPKPGEPAVVKVGLGRRWPVERTDSWLSNFGQLCRNTDRRAAQRNAQFCLAIVFLLTAKLIDWRNLR